MNDRELIEMAAKAAGMEINQARQAERDALIDPETAGIWIKGGSTDWNPLTDDADALRLAVKLSMMLDIYSGVLVGHDQNYALNITDAWHERDNCDSPGSACSEPHNADPYAATRRAITRAAAEIGKAM